MTWITFMEVYVTEELNRPSPLQRSCKHFCISDILDRFDPFPIYPMEPGPHINTISLYCSLNRIQVSYLADNVLKICKMPRKIRFAPLPENFQFAPPPQKISSFSVLMVYWSRATKYLSLRWNWEILWKFQISSSCMFRINWMYHIIDRNWVNEIFGIKVRTSQAKMENYPLFFNDKQT